MSREPLAQLETELAGLLASMDSKARRTLARQIAKQLQASQQLRIRDQLNPDGTAFAPRKPQMRAQKGRLRRQMFTKLRQSKWLKTEVSPDTAAVQFVAQVERIAAVHQYGLRDKVGGRSKAEATYPARELLGFTAQDIEQVRAKLVDHIAGTS